MVSLRSKLALAISMAFGVSAYAQEAVKGIETPVMTLGEVPVIGQATGPLATRNVFTSVDVLQESKIVNQVISHNWQLFAPLPGVMLTNYGQGNTSGKLSMRGFSSEGEVNPVKLLIDGIPSNSHDGMMPYLDLVPLMDIQAIELVRGTNDPRYGLHNIAGNANIVTRSGDNYQTGRIGYGSFNTRDLQAAAGFDKDGFSQNYALTYQESDGYREHSASRKAGFSGKWFYSPDNGASRYGLIVRHHESSAEEPGFLTYAESRANWRQSRPHNASDEGNRQLSQVALQSETALGNQMFWTAQVYQNSLDDKRYLRFTAAASQQERITTEGQLGVSTTLTWRPGSTRIGELTVVGGLDAERQDNVSQRYRTSQQVRAATLRNWDFDFNTVGGFVQAIYKPVADLTITPAFRVDKLSGNFRNLINGSVYDINNYGLINQPKLSAVYQLNDAYSVYGNWGRTFQVGIGDGAYRIQNYDLAPSINEGWEAGVKFRPLHWVEGRIAVWEQYASKEVRRNNLADANTAENIGETKRSGVDLQLNMQPTSRLSLWVGAAAQRALIVKAETASAATEGKEIDHTPRLLYSAGADYRVNEAWRLSSSVSGQGSYYLNRMNNSGKFGGYSIINASATYRLAKNMDVDLQVRNLANRYYEYVWEMSGQSLHAPGSPRSVHLMLTSRF